MSIPRCVFVDTSFFQAKRFAFSSELLSSFAEACQRSEVTFLLPITVEREIEHHLDAMAREAVRSLQSLVAKSPFLKGLENWPPERKGAFDEHAAGFHAKRMLAAFWKKLTLVRLDYATVNLAEVMDWYTKKQPPFSEKKKHEFPDAFAISSLLAYAKEHRTEIAVVSNDEDFRSACDNHHQLLFFSNVGALTQTLLSVDSRVVSMKAVIDANRGLLESAIQAGFLDLQITVIDADDAEVNDVEVLLVEGLEPSIIAVGENECTVEIEAEVTFSATIACDDPNSCIRDPDSRSFIALHRIDVPIEETEHVYAIAKLRLEGPTMSVVSLEMDQGEIDVTISDPYDD